MCTVLLPPGVNPVAFNEYTSYHIICYGFSLSSKHVGGIMLSRTDCILKYLCILLVTLYRIVDWCTEMNNINSTLQYFGIFTIFWAQLFIRTWEMGYGIWSWSRNARFVNNFLQQKLQVVPKGVNISSFLELWAT